jgi:hypothetical protein
MMNLLELVLPIQEKAPYFLTGPGILWNAERVGLEIIHPDYILFGDETGCNTSQKRMAMKLEPSTLLVAGKYQGHLV